MVLSQGMRLAGVGVLIGLVAAVALGRLLATQLYGVSPVDPVTIAAAAAIFVGRRDARELAAGRSRGPHGAGGSVALKLRPPLHLTRDERAAGSPTSSLRHFPSAAR